MPTLPPRSLSPIDSRGRRTLRLPNGTGTCLMRGEEWADGGDPLGHNLGWVWNERLDPSEAEITDLTDDEIREICGAPADKRESVIARICASRSEITYIWRDGRSEKIAPSLPDAASPSAFAPAPRTYTLSVPDGEGDRVLTYPGGQWRWLLTGLSEAGDSFSPLWAQDYKSDFGACLAIDLLLSEEETLSLLTREGREDRIAQIRASRPAPAYSPAFSESLRAQGLGAREPICEPEDLVAEPPHYRLPGDREALEDVIAPICDALASRGIGGAEVYMIGNALKYISRLGAKGSALEDLRKAREYLDRAIARMTAE